ncbi:hypothetical protein BGX26_009276, partial [Mortierella sp. AD094]
TGEWDQVKQLIAILKPFEDMTLVFSSASNGIAAAVAPWVVAILAELEKEDNSQTEVMETFRRTLIYEVKKRLDITNEYLIASALHPTFKNLWFLEDSIRVNVIKKRLREEFNTIAPTRPQQEQRPEDDSDQVGGSSVLHKLLKRQRERSDVDGSNEQEGTDMDEFDRYFKLDLRCKLVKPLI